MSTKNLFRCSLAASLLLAVSVVGLHPTAGEETDKSDRVRDQGTSGGAAKEKDEKVKAAEKVPGKVIPGESIYFSGLAINPAGYVKGEPTNIMVELNRLVTTTFPETYTINNAHLHPWRKRWDEFTRCLDAHRQVSVFVLQPTSFLDAATNTKSRCSDASEGKLAATRATWILAYFGYAYGHRPVRLRTVRIDEGKIHLSYARTRRGDDPNEDVGRSGNDAVVIIDCGKLQPGEYEIHLNDESSKTTELVRRFSVVR